MSLILQPEPDWMLGDWTEYEEDEFEDSDPDDDPE